MGISQADRNEIAKNYDSRYTSVNVANAVTNGGRTWLMPEAFWNNSQITYNDRDLTGIIVHELFHVAGYGKAWESRIKSLSKEIQNNCSHANEAYNQNIQLGSGLRFCNFRIRFDVATSITGISKFRWADSLGSDDSVVLEKQFDDRRMAA